MDLKRLSNKSSQFTVGNINDYINVINKTNVSGNSKVTVEDLQELEKRYNGLRCSYNIETYKDNLALKTINISSDLYLNIYLT